MICRQLYLIKFTFQYASIKPRHTSYIELQKNKFTFQYASIKPVSKTSRYSQKIRFTFQYASIKPCIALLHQVNLVHLHFNMLLLNHKYPTFVDVTNSAFTFQYASIKP